MDKRHFNISMTFSHWDLARLRKFKSYKLGLAGCNVCRTHYAIEHSKNKILDILRSRLDLECSGPVFNKPAVLQECLATKTNQYTINGLSFVPMAFLWNECLFNSELEHTRSNLIFEESRIE